MSSILDPLTFVKTMHLPPRAPWIRSLSDRAAHLMVAVLRDHPRSAAHFSGLAQDGTVDLRIGAAIQEALR
ncbi:hypothetical protein [Streptomyces sp. NPDC058653]|uniref:hypothetical protein n=1 Tax=Streptomyces sp. NPDC058653 TaxID=3346576 RepID=UPI0036685013